MGIMIRKAHLTDAAQILHIYKEAIDEGNSFITRPEEFRETIVTIQQWLKKPQQIVFVAEDAQQIMGWLSFQTTSTVAGYITMVVCHTSRGKGVGSQLLAHIIKWVEVHPTIDKIALNVFSTNLDAMALYTKFGFQQEGRKVRAFKIDDDYVDDILMYRML